MEQINELIVSLVGPNGKLNDIYSNTEKKISQLFTGNYQNTYC